VSARRLPLLLVALAATAGWAALGESPAEPVTAAGNAIEPLPAIRALLARVPSAAGTDPFALPPPPPIPETVAVPREPTLPAAPGWHCIGKQRDEDTRWSVFLARGNETRVVRIGDTLDDAYRVTAIAPPTLTLLHLKTKTHRTIDIGVTRE
jgi:hypothetical protein